MRVKIIVFFYCNGQSFIVMAFYYTQTIPLKYSKLIGILTVYNYRDLFTTRGMR